MEDEMESLVMLAVMAICMEHFKVKWSHLEVHIGYYNIRNQIKELKSKEIRITFVPIYPPLGTNGRGN